MATIYSPDTTLKTEHGGRATITHHVADGVYMTTAGTLMEDIDGVMYDLTWTKVGRQFRRKDGRVVVVSVSGKVME